jgi:hypothetical protein
MKKQNKITKVRDLKPLKDVKGGLIVPARRMLNRREVRR